MKKIVLLTIAVLSLFVMTTTAFAKSSATYGRGEVDASLVLATAPASGFDTGWGINIGGGIMMPQINKDFQGRVELSYFTWSASEFGFDVTYKRMPIGAGGRFYLPVHGNVKVYVQGLAELSFDEVEVVVPGFGPIASSKASESDVNFGIVPGAGIEVPISPTMGFVADARWHLITDNYFTLQGGLAFHF